MPSKSAQKSTNEKYMTYEEFKQLAEHPQFGDFSTIFKVEVIDIQRMPKGKRFRYPKFDVYDSCIIAFAPNLEEAKALMRKHVYSKQRKEEDEHFTPLETFCYYITEFPMGLVYEGLDSAYISKRMYDAEGDFIDQTYCTSGFSWYDEEPSPEKLPETRFLGRPKQAVRFHEGDIVEVYNGHKVELGIVSGTPLTIGDIWQREERCFIDGGDGIEGVSYDEYGDVYKVLATKADEGPEHVSPMCVCAPHYPVPLDIQRQLRDNLETDKMYTKAHNSSFANLYEVERSERCGCFFCGKIFSPSKITNCVSSEEPTVECPYCYTDSVIGDASGFPITPEFLRKMRRRFF